MSEIITFTPPKTRVGAVKKELPADLVKSLLEAAQKVGEDDVAGIANSVGETKTAAAYLAKRHRDAVVLMLDDESKTVKTRVWEKDGKPAKDEKDNAVTGTWLWGIQIQDKKQDES